jgi:hypothetical protein
MAPLGKSLAGICEWTGSFSAGMLCNGLATLLQKSVEVGSLSGACAVLGLCPATSTPVLVTIGLLGGAAFVKGVIHRRKARDIAERLEAIDTASRTAADALPAIRDAIEASGVAIKAADMLQIADFVRASVTKDIDAIPAAIIERIEVTFAEAKINLAERLAKIDDELRSLHAEVRTLQVKVPLGPLHWNHLGSYLLSS